MLCKWILSVLFYHFKERPLSTVLYALFYACDERSAMTSIKDWNLNLNLKYSDFWSSIDQPLCNETLVPRDALRKRTNFKEVTNFCLVLSSFETKQLFNFFFWKQIIYPHYHGLDMIPSDCILTRYRESTLHKALCIPYFYPRCGYRHNCILFIQYGIWYISPAFYLLPCSFML